MDKKTLCHLLARYYLELEDMYLLPEWSEEFNPVRERAVNLLVTKLEWDLWNVYAEDWTVERFKTIK
jgi:hypothetical protein